MLTLDMPNAWIVCWSLDETSVQICPNGRNDKPVWCKVQEDTTTRRLFCEYKGRYFHLQFI